MTLNVSEWVIEPFQSLGPLRFGMRRGEPQQVLSEPPTEFKKGFSDNVTEAYNGAGVHVYYDANGVADFFEAFGFGSNRPTYRGVDLLRREADDVVRDLAALGLAVRDDGQGSLWFDDSGFALIAPTGNTEGVSVFRRGYYTGV